MDFLEGLHWCMKLLLSATIKKDLKARHRARSLTTSRVLSRQVFAWIRVLCHQLLLGVPVSRVADAMDWLTTVQKGAPVGWGILEGTAVSRIEGQ